MLRRTIHTARYLSDPVYRRRITRQLNKGESLHALRRDLHYAQQGAITKPHLTEQTEQAWCLTVLTSALVTWTTQYYTLGVKQLRADGRSVPGELLAHISPATPRTSTSSVLLPVQRCCWRRRGRCGRR
jgi:TnpA family transposase